MKTYTKEELIETLRLHALWTKTDIKGIRADLRSADLYGANLYGADLRSADLYGANLYGANLRSADLRSANLYGADLRSADLYGANLYGADLRSANLYGANLYGANLRSADLRSANLYGANLRSADLRSADLRSANLYGANLSSADLYGADLRSADLRSANLYGANLSSADLYGADLRSANLYGANLYGADLKNLKEPLSANTIAQFRIIPEVGGFYGYKKVSDNTVLKIYISKNAKRLNSFGSRKCRAERVKVISAINMDGTESKMTKFTNSTHTEKKTVYEIGKWVSVSDFCNDLSQECAPGIHFFLTFEEAKAW